MGDENTVYVGQKGVMAYVLAVVTQFNNGAGEVHLKARGKSISRAADVTQIVKNRFIPSLQIRDIRVHTEELTDEAGVRSKVTSMHFVLARE
jgi:DNA-binding protein